MSWATLSGSVAMDEKRFMAAARKKGERKDE